MRADARRNYERIVAIAEPLIAEQGADVSLEEVARVAGVGSATLHRHFPSRQALLEAVFKGRVAVLCARADEFSAALPPADALIVWLHALGAHAVANRGLGTSLLRGAQEATGGDPAFGADCHTMITDAGQRLLDRAAATGTIRPEVTVVRLLTLVSALATAAEADPDGPAETRQLLDLALAGIHTPGS
ncbi:putative TetR family transcriptional regulator [Kitasatospora setae KM-6054]|uniref:Putative TetR family transcriptional regulator n=2 Tax=Streptomycetaceae TaxID=2062 RepID=E4N3D0_KITSK|nr:TetR/AcrR family transcriptional regulator [Kitasatospora sp. SID7827]BAJ32664.1 putative TetR family transcriptional regulator [Kitasatospora setae KM-6054]